MGIKIKDLSTLNKIRVHLEKMLVGLIFKGVIKLKLLI